MSFFRDLWNGCRKLNIKSAAAFIASGTGTALVGALAGPKAAGVAGVVAGLIVSQHDPVLPKPDAAPAPTDGDRVNAAVAAPVAGPVAAPLPGD